MCLALERPKHKKDDLKNPTKQLAIEIGNKYAFDITKADESFDQLFSARQLS